MGTRGGFFGSGVTCACLKAVGNVPEASEALSTCVTAGTTVRATAWRRLVEMGSRVHVVGYLPVKSLNTSPSERGMKEWNNAVGHLHLEFVALLTGEDREGHEGLLLLHVGGLIRPLTKGDTLCPSSSVN